MEVINEFRCTVCNKVFPSKTDLLRHKNLHIKNKLFSCNICFKTFSKNYNLEIHRRKHTGEKPFLCDDCDSSFVRKYGLQRHQKIHTGEKKHVCNVCDKAFARRDYLNKHSVTHKAKRNIYTGEKPFQCDVCDTSFARKDKLQRHQKIHTGEKKHICNVCDKAFARKDILNKHSATHNPNRGTFQCDVCNNSYSSKESLHRHQKIHTGEKNHVYNVCDRAFTRKDILNNHLKIHNDENDTTKQIIESNHCVPISKKSHLILNKPASSLQKFDRKNKNINLKNGFVRIKKLEIKTQKSSYKLTKNNSTAILHVKVSVDIQDPNVKDREIETEQIQENADEDVAHIEEIHGEGQDLNVEEDQVPVDFCQQCSSEKRNISQFICPHFFKLN